ncbi:MAG: class I tRNA ligase family protein, partial [Clostridiales bacterium]|nr:class I tRNA ligase family protein [Clostridiales bacterium]
YYARSSWFIAMTKVKDQLVASNRMANWYPETIRDGRMGNFLENVVDWGISRERYWGTPLPVWECECGHRECIGSIEELKAKSTDCPDDIELHKPYVDNVHVTCEKCGKPMTRVSEVIDCWFDSGAMPFAQFHYPFENKEFFESHYPCQFISEALDQTRGWFYSLLAISTQLFGRSPFENVIVMGLVQDKDGIKMSKHKGNVVDPWDILNRQGADAARWYFYSANAPWLPSRFDHSNVDKILGKFMGTLWNTYAFYILYAEIDQFDPTKYSLEYDKLSVMDKWILSRLASLEKTVDSKMQGYDITGASRLMENFVDDLSNWYVRRGRERYWGKEMTQDKINAFMTLYTALEQFTRLAAPFIPFMTEAIYQNLVRSVNADAPMSIHMCDYPVAEEAWIDEDLERNMDDVQQIVTLALSCRQAANLKIRQPLSKLYAVCEDELPSEYQTIIKEELNVHEVAFLKDASSLLDYKFKPQLRTLGRKLGAKLNAAKEVIAALPGKETMAALDKDGKINIEVEGETFELLTEDLLVENVQPEGLSTQADKGFTVSLDTKLDDALIEEGFVREIVSKIQNQRKKSGFEVTDRITVKYSCGEKLAAVFTKFGEQIASDVLATSIEEGSDDNATELDINGEKVNLSLKKA